MGAASPRTGSKFETDFQLRWEGLGKRAWLYRFQDASDLYGRNNGLVIVDAQPSDFLCAFAGIVALVEAKATKDAKGFKASLLRLGQRAAIVRSIVAKTPHYLAIRNENTQQVFLVPVSFLQPLSGTFSWESLSQFIWQSGDPWERPNTLT